MRDKNRLKNIGLKIQMLRKQHDMTQEEFAKILSVTRSYVGYIEQGRKYPSLKLLMKIAVVLEVKLPDILTT